jgi:hypothetical protein
MKPARIVALVNASATGTASVADLQELSGYSLRQLLRARKRFRCNASRRPSLVIPSPRLIRVLHAFIHAFLSRPTASHAPATHSTP